MMTILTLLRDVLAFSNQFFPHPIALLRSYRFSPADLAIEPPAKDHQQPLTTIDVLSYNVNNEAAHHPTRRRHILRAIFSSGAQIILLQETNPSWEELLREDAVALEFAYTYFHHPRPSDRKAGGSAILSQFPLDYDKIQMFDFSDNISGSVFPSMVCDVTIPIKPMMGSSRTVSSTKVCNSNTVTITIANIHLRPPVNLDGSAWLDTARKTEPIRIHEVKELLRRSQESQRTIDIIAGDFNEGDAGGAIMHLISEGYTNSLSQYVPRRKETHRWNYFGKVWQLRKRLDHILRHSDVLSSTRREEDCRLKLDCINCGVLSGYENNASDHQPILSRFAINMRMDAKFK